MYKYKPCPRDRVNKYLTIKKNFLRAGAIVKINEMAKYSGVNSETIRKYRDRGLMRPEQNPENGYYEYTHADFLNLLYIRKLRGAGLSLDTIASTCENGDSETILAGYRKTIQELKEQISQLKRREMMLDLTARHYERDAEAYGTIRLIEAFDVKYDSYLGKESPDKAVQFWIQNVDLFTLVVCIERKWFDPAQPIPEQIPLRIGLGTYQNILDEVELPIPEDVRVFPRGRYASFFLELDNLDFVFGEKLEPVRAFLRDHGLTPLRDSTAYLYRVDTGKKTPQFIFCVRVLIEETPADISTSSVS